MEGVRFKTMARLLILVGAFLACCEAHFGHHRNIFINRGSDFRAFRPVEDHKCFGLARRTFLFNHIITVPCQQVTPQMSVIAAEPSRNGNICKAQVKIPQTKYYRVQRCCTGWTMDKLGMCRIPTGPMSGHVDISSASPFVARSLPMMIALHRMSPFSPNPNMLSQMRNMISIRKMQMGPMQMHMTQVNRPPVAPVSPVMTKLQKLAQITGMKLPSLQQKIIEIARNPALQEKLRELVKMQEQKNKPQTQSTTQQRNIKIIQASTPNPRPTTAREQFPGRQMPMMSGGMPRMMMMVPGRLRMLKMMAGHPMMHKMQMMMSGRMPMPPGRMGMIPRPPMMHSEMVGMVPDGQRMDTPDPDTQQQVVQETHETMMPDSHVGCMDPTHGHDIDSTPQQGDGSGMRPDGVSLPMSPVDMPEIRVQPGPNFQMEPPQTMINCMRTFAETITRCFADADVPPPPPAEAFNVDAASPLVQTLCSKKTEIIRCIVEGQGSCETRQEVFLVRRSVRGVAVNLDKICSQLSDLPTDETETPRPEPPAEEVKSMTVSKETSALDTQNQRLPTDEILETETDVKAEAVVAEDTKPDHEVGVEEIEKVEEYYLPLLIGTTIGFVALLIMLSALVCLCCKRRYKRKMSISKEPEKPRLFDGIYTIGVPPPVYEVAGIPPLSYEEAKGEMVGVHRPREQRDIPAEGENSHL